MVAYAQQRQPGTKKSAKPTLQQQLTREIAALTATQRRFYIQILQALDGADTQFVTSQSIAIFFQNTTEVRQDYVESKVRRTNGALNEAFELLIQNYTDAAFLMQLGKMRSEHGNISFSKEQRTVIGEIHSRYKLLLGLEETDDIFSAEVSSQVWVSAINLKKGMRSYFDYYPTIKKRTSN